MAGAAKGARLYAFITRKEIGKLAGGKEVRAVGFVPGSGAVAAALPKAVVIYDRITLKPLRTLPAPGVLRFDFNAKATLMLVRTDDALELRDAASGALRWRKGEASRGREQLKAFDIASGSKRWFVTGGSALSIFTLAPGLLVSGADAGTIWVWRYR